MSDLYLHIGAHKTASTLLQSELKKDRSPLAQQLNIVFREEVNKTNFYHSLKKAKAGDEVSDFEGDEIYSLLRADKDNLITNEDLFSGLSVGDFFKGLEVGLPMIKSHLSKFNVRVILYTRAQSEYVESMYLQQLHMGRLVEFDDFVGEYIPEALSWLDVCRSIEGVVGKENLIVKPYEMIKEIGPQEYYRDFLRALQVRGFGSFAVDHASTGRKYNRSFSQKAIEIYKALYSLLNEDELKKLRVFLQNHFSTQEYSRPKLFDELRRKRVFEFYKKSNAQLFSEYMPQYDRFSQQYF